MFGRRWQKIRTTPLEKKQQQQCVSPLLRAEHNRPHPKIIITDSTHTQRQKKCKRPNDDSSLSYPSYAGLPSLPQGWAGRPKRNNSPAQPTPKETLLLNSPTGIRMFAKGCVSNTFSSKKKSHQKKKLKTTHSNGNGVLEFNLLSVNVLWCCTEPNRKGNGRHGRKR